MDQLIGLDLDRGGSWVDSLHAPLQSHHQGKFFSTAPLAYSMAQVVRVGQVLLL